MFWPINGHRQSLHARHALRHPRRRRRLDDDRRDAHADAASFRDNPPVESSSEQCSSMNPRTCSVWSLEPGHEQSPPRGVILLQASMLTITSAPGLVYTSISPALGASGVLRAAFRSRRYSADSATRPACSDDDLHPAAAVDDSSAPAGRYLRNRYQPTGPDARRRVLRRLSRAARSDRRIARRAHSGGSIPSATLRQSGTRPTGLQIAEIVS